MPRRPRLNLAEVPLHVIERSNKRRAIVGKYDNLIIQKAMPTVHFNYAILYY